MRHWAVLTLTLCPFVLTQQSLAYTVDIDPSVATASAIAPSAIIEDDLKAHTWSIHPKVGYFTGTSTVDGEDSTASSHGFAGTGEAVYSLNDHIGINFSFMDFKGSGSYTPGSGEVPGGSPGSSSVSGWLFGAALVLDPFSGDGFRMPFFFGLNYEALRSSTPTSPLVTSLSLNSPGYTLGFSPRFTVGFLRIEPFMVTTTPTSKGNVTCGPNISEGPCGAQSIQLLPVFGVNVIYLPWKIAFYFNLSTFLISNSVAFYSVGPQWTF